MCLGDSTQPWTPKARLHDLYSPKKTTYSTKPHNDVTKPLCKQSIEEVGWCVPIRINLISALSQTEFNICPNISAKESLNKTFDDTENSINKDIGSVPVMLAVSASEKWKGGIKQFQTSKIRSDIGEMAFATASALKSKQSNIGGTGSTSVTRIDSENRHWTLDLDLHSASLRFLLSFQDISKIPRNHLM